MGGWQYLVKDILCRGIVVCSMDRYVRLGYTFSIILFNNLRSYLRGPGRRVQGRQGWGHGPAAAHETVQGPPLGGLGPQRREVPPDAAPAAPVAAAGAEAQLRGRVVGRAAAHPTTWGHMEHISAGLQEKCNYFDDYQFVC